MFGIYRKIKYFLFCLVLASAFLASTQIYSQVSENVYDDTVYHYLDKLAAVKLIRTYSPNQRPLTRYAVAKMIIEARGRVSEKGDGRMSRILVELEEKFRPEIETISKKEKRVLNFVPLDSASFLWALTNQPEEVVPNNGLGSTNGRVQPLLSYQDGRHYRRFYNTYYDVVARLRASPYFALLVQPQFYAVSSYLDEPLDGGGTLLRGYIKGGYKNFELQVGRDSLWWGPGAEALFFSNNPQPLDMLKLTNPSTFRLPWVLKYLGQWRLTGFFAWLKDYTPKNPILSGYRVDYQPFFWLDVGFDHAVFMGGRGAKDPGVKTAIGEYIGFIFDSGNSKASSNHLMGFDATISVPPLNGAKFYGKVLFEDTNKEYDLMYLNNASWLGGVYLPYVDGGGRLSLRGEFVHTGEYAYRHGFYQDGFALNEKFLGYDAGPDTYSVLARTNYMFGLNEFIGGDLRYLWRSSNTYRTTTDATGDQSGIAVNWKGPKEQHCIFKLNGQKRVSKILNLYGEAGLDYTTNKYFRSNDNALDFSFLVKFIFVGL